MSYKPKNREITVDPASAIALGTIRLDGVLAGDADEPDLSNGAVLTRHLSEGVLEGITGPEGPPGQDGEDGAPGAPGAPGAGGDNLTTIFVKLPTLEATQYNTSSNARVVIDMSGATADGIINLPSTDSNVSHEVGDQVLIARVDGTHSDHPVSIQTRFDGWADGGNPGYQLNDGDSLLFIAPATNTWELAIATNHALGDVGDSPTFSGYRRTQYPPTRAELLAADGTTDVGGADFAAAAVHGTAIQPALPVVRESLPLPDASRLVVAMIYNADHVSAYTLPSGASPAHGWLDLVDVSSVTPYDLWDATADPAIPVAATPAVDGAVITLTIDAFISLSGVPRPVDQEVFPPFGAPYWRRRTVTLHLTQDNVGGHQVVISPPPTGKPWQVNPAAGSTTIIKLEWLGYDSGWVVTDCISAAAVSGTTTVAPYLQKFTSAENWNPSFFEPITLTGVYAIRGLGTTSIIHHLSWLYWLGPNVTAWMNTIGMQYFIGDVDTPQLGGASPAVFPGFEGDYHTGRVEGTGSYTNPTGDATPSQAGGLTRAGVANTVGDVTGSQNVIWLGEIQAETLSVNPAFHTRGVNALAGIAGVVFTATTFVFQSTGQSTGLVAWHETGHGVDFTWLTTAGVTDPYGTTARSDGKAMKPDGSLATRLSDTAKWQAHHTTYLSTRPRNNFGVSGWLPTNSTGVAPYAQTNLIEGWAESYAAWAYFKETGLMDALDFVYGTDGIGPAGAAEMIDFCTKFEVPW